MNTINFELTQPISYANGSGQKIECNHIELRAPTGKVSNTCCAIESMVQSAILKMSDVLDEATLAAGREAAATKAEEALIDEENADEVKDGDGILAMMVGSGVDMNKIVLLFRELFMVVGYMGGEKPLTSVRLDDMCHKDLRRMIGAYAANFILD